MPKGNQPNYSELVRYISIERLSSYRIIVRKQSPKNLIAAYHWNKHVSASLYPILQCLEVTLRNALHISASKAFGASDWYEIILKQGGDVKFKADYPRWQTKYFRKSAGYPDELGKRAWKSNHENMLLGIKSHLCKENKPLSASNVIAGVMFGFWVSFFEDAYAGTDPKLTLWPHLERDIFVKGKKVQDRKSAHDLLLKIKELRNRMSHHEPVWKTKGVNDDVSAVNFLVLHLEYALNLIESMSPERYNFLIRSGKVDAFRLICNVNRLREYLQGKYLLDASEG